MLLRGLILVAALGLTASAAQSSTLVPADLRTAGDNLLTIDTATGLVWLDLTETVSQSFNQIKAQLRPGGTLEGFRYATLSEVVELWKNAGIDTSGLPEPLPTGANFAPVMAFQALVGLTDPNPFAHDSIGLVDDTDFFQDHFIPFARVFFGGPFAGQGFVITSITRSPDQAFFNHGSWLVQGTPPPDTTITSTTDGTGAAIANGGSTLSTSITFAFGETDNVRVASFQCSLDGAQFITCTSPQSFAGLSVGSHTFQVRAVDAAGNLDPSPASLTWTVLTPLQATQVLIDDTVIRMELPRNVQTSLLAPLNQAINLLNDNNPNNDAAVCGKLNAFINQVNAKEGNGRLTAEQADQLRQSANAIKASLGCT